MRDVGRSWVLVVGLIGCLPADFPCEDVPLTTTCPVIRGAWRIDASQRLDRCDAALFDEPLRFSNRSHTLTITIKELVATGVLYESGAFEAMVQTPRVIRLRGQVRGSTMQGSVEVFEAPRGCESTWQFTATR